MKRTGTSSTDPAAQLFPAGVAATPNLTLRGQLAPAAGFSSSAPTRQSARHPFVRRCPRVSTRSHRSTLILPQPMSAWRAANPHISTLHSACGCSPSRGKEVAGAIDG